MEVNTVTSGSVPTWYFVDNLLTGETVELRPCGGGQFSDYPMGSRYGHQAPASLLSGLTGIAGWRLGGRANYVTLSTTTIAALYTSANTFGSTGALADPVWLQDGNERTLVQQSTQPALPSYGSGGIATSSAQLEIRQGSNRVLLSQANAADLAPQLLAIGAT